MTSQLGVCTFVMSQFVFFRSGVQHFSAAVWFSSGAVRHQQVHGTRGKTDTEPAKNIKFHKRSLNVSFWLWEHHLNYQRWKLSKLMSRFSSSCASCGCCFSLSWCFFTGIFLLWTPILRTKPPWTTWERRTRNRSWTRRSNRGLVPMAWQGLIRMRRDSRMTWDHVSPSRTRSKSLAPVEVCIVRSGCTTLDSGLGCGWFTSLLVN